MTEPMLIAVAGAGLRRMVGEADGTGRPACWGFGLIKQAEAVATRVRGSP